MSAEHKVVWKCDRCGVLAEMPSGKQPPWLGVLFGTPPDASPSDRMWPRMHLCRDCDKAFAAFLSKGSTDD